MGDDLVCLVCENFTLAGAPMAYLPMKVVVVGTPLSLKREALGLDMSGPEPLLGFGEVRTSFLKVYTLILRRSSLRTDWSQPTCNSRFTFFCNYYFSVSRGFLVRSGDVCG